MPVLSPRRASAATPIRLLVATLAALLLGWFATSPAWAADAGFSLSAAGPQAGATVTATAGGTNNPTATYGWTLVGAAQWATGGTIATVAELARRGAHHRARRQGPGQDGQQGPNTQGPNTQGPNTPSPNSPPSTPAISANPARPTTGRVVTFTGSATDPDAGDTVTYWWSIDGTRSGGARTTHTFARPGTFPVSLTVSDASGATAGATGSITVENLPPTGDFTWSPSAPRTGQAFKLTASGSDPDGTITNVEWDLDGNGSYADAVDAVGRSTTVRFDTPGQHVVNLRITDDSGSTTVVTRKISVDSPPSAGFTWSPGTPVVGQAVTFTSTSSDPGGSVVAIDWDLDGDGKLNDGRGASGQRAFSAAGTYKISVRATDNTGLTAVATQPITVVAAPPPPATIQAQNTSPTAKPPRTALNAVVRLSGVITSRGARIMRLTVKGPPGASVTAGCRGRGCPRAPKPLLITAHKATVHLRSLERTLPAGVRITVVVTQSGRIGKYTRFTIRRNKSPARRDMCVTGRRITKCPP